MAKRFGVSNTIFENLVRHLVEVEEQKDKLLEEYFQKSSKERDELKILIDNYIKNVESLIRKAHNAKTAGDSLLFVTIGSDIEIENLSTHEVHSFRLVTPFSRNIDSKDVSYISPVGKALLLKKVGEEVVVNAPGGLFRYKIKSIKWPDD